jgi:hypothetical protein
MQPVRIYIGIRLHKTVVNSDAPHTHLQQPLQPFSPNKEMPFVIKTKSTGSQNAIPRIGVNSRINPPIPHHMQRSVPKPLLAGAETEQVLQQESAVAVEDEVGADEFDAAPEDEYEEAADVEEEVEYAAPTSGDPTQLVLKKQLVDIAKRLKREVEEKDQVV